MWKRTPEAQKLYSAHYYLSRREEICAKVAARKAADPEKHRARRRERYAANRAKERQKLHERYWRDPEKSRAAKREDHQKHREKRVVTQRTKRAANPAKARADAKKHRQRRWQVDPEKERAKEREAFQRREAAKKGASICDLTAAQFLEVQIAQDHRCYYCKKRRKGKLTQDHLTPVTKGGSHTLHNIIAVCQSCNSRKGTRPPPIPVQPFLLTVAPAKKRKTS